MKKISQRVLALLLATSMVGSLTACGKDKGTDANSESVSGTETGTAAENEALSYEDESALVYDAQLGDFYNTYMEANEAETVAERYALMAVSEAKLLEAAVMVPIHAKGGSYAVSNVAPYTVPYALWGNDNERIHQSIVCNETITLEDRNEMKAKWAELKGTGEYEAWVKSFLADKGYTIKDTYNYVYSSDPQTWDVLATSQAADSENIVQTYDGLMEYDIEGTLQPALAESYEVSEDGLTYTFKIREGVKWVDSQGREVADVVADDFVAGMQHMMDSMGGLEYLVQGVIVGANEYINGEITDFAEVGVKAVDTYTLEYTLEAPCSYFTTMLGYGVFAPMSRTYYESQGGKFGLEYDSSAADYNYGKTKDNIAYCGPYLVTNATEKNTIVFEANPTYWNKDNINIQKYQLFYDSAEDATKTYTDFKAGTIDATPLTTSSLEIAKEDGTFDTYAYVTTPDATSFMGFYNLNRAAFANFNDETKAVSPQTEEDAARTNAAMSNVHFRLALSMSFDRGTYMAQRYGDDLKYTSMRNTYIPGQFVSLPEEVTIQINGTDTTFAAGTFYGEIVQAQLTADEFPVVVYKADADNGTDGFDAWYLPEVAVEELETAIAELEAEGVTVSAEEPIYIDYPAFTGSEVFANMATAYKQSIESVLGGKVIVNLVECVSSEEWYYAGYYPSTGSEANFDFCDVSGWGPDFGDPCTYLDTMLPDYAGYMTKQMGIY